MQTQALMHGYEAHEGATASEGVNDEAQFPFS